MSATLRIGTSLRAAAGAGALALGSCSAGGTTATTVDYGDEPQLLRVGEAVAIQPSGGPGIGFTAVPSLPAGLALDPLSGAITGTPTAAAAGQDYTITGLVAGGVVTDVVHIAIGAALPAEIASLEVGFQAERFAWLTEPPGKFAVAPDGRVFVTERSSGVIRIVDPDGVLVTTPFATVPVSTGNHRGLLGLALSPAFATDRRVFALATTPAGGGRPERSVLYRWTEAVGIGQDETVLLDDLPVAQINNGGALCFDPAGMLFVTIGDVEDPSLAQDDGSLAGKILRIDPDDGSAPPDNPTPGNIVFCKGTRNTWALAIEPVAGSLFGADNGPADNDELNLVQPGRNFEWGAAPGASFGAQAGVRLRLWPDVVVPTGLAFADPAQADWPEEHRRSLFLSLYDEEIVQRFELSGPLRTDIDREVDFLHMTPNANANKPVDLLRGPDGTLWLLTFAAIYRIDRVR